jgi:DNA-binding CsgD family transcriptional regulator
MKRTPRMLLTIRQRSILDMIVRYHRATGEACPASYLARRFNLHHSTVQEHVSALYKKGWLFAPNAPSLPHSEVRSESPAKFAAPQDLRD